MKSNQQDKGMSPYEAKAPLIIQFHWTQNELGIAYEIWKGQDGGPIEEDTKFGLYLVGKRFTKK